ncbi:MAG: DUF3887 domain-containing protein [Oscillospiraceae bacterium]|nr:DUF3887 domain-containing protein [Oscillospiraceae bacterium]
MRRFFGSRGKGLLAALLSFMLLAIAGGCANNGEPADDTALEVNGAIEDVSWDFYNERARMFVLAVAGGDFDAAAAMFSEAMMQGFGAEGLEDAWEDIIGLAGEFVEIHDIENAVLDGYYVSGLIMRHADFGFGWNVVFAEDGTIAGLWSGGTIPLAGLVAHSGRPQTAIQRDGFTDYPIIIGESTGFPLNSILSMPDR